MSPHPEASDPNPPKGMPRSGWVKWLKPDPYALVLLGVVVGLSFAFRTTSLPLLVPLAMPMARRAIKSLDSGAETRQNACFDSAQAIKKDNSRPLRPIT